MTADADASDALCLEAAHTLTSSPRQALRQEKSDEDDGVRSSVVGSGWTPLVLLGGMTCCFGSALPAGFNIGVMNNPADVMQEFCNTTFKYKYGIDVSKSEMNIIWGAVVSIFLIGGVTGSFLASWISDRFGRRGALAAGNICGIVGALFFILSPALSSVELLMAGRLVVGLSGGIATSVLPTYMTEIAPLKLRGAVGVLCQLGITVGVFGGQLAGLDSVLGTRDTWHIMLGSFAPLCILSLILLRILPESPKYLYIIKRREDAAIGELRRLRRVNVALIQDEICSLREEAALRTTMDTWTIGRVLKDPSVRLPLLLVCSLQLGQQLSGINAVFYYSNYIFEEKSNMSKIEAQYATLGTGVINIVMACISVWLMSRYRRTTLFQTSSILIIICLIVLCATLQFIDALPSLRIVCIVVVQGYVLFYGLGLGPIPYFIGSELFEVGPRPAAMALGSVCNWGGNFIVGMLFPPLQDLMGSLVFLIFATFTTLVAIFARYYLPETRGVDTAVTASKLTHGFKSLRTRNT